MAMTVGTKRVYAPPSADDGLRVLVDRIWPRGLAKQAASLDCWMKEVAPTTRLRKWFGHRPERWSEFGRRYRAELRENPSVQEFRELARNRCVTLLYAAHDTEHNHALILAEFLRRTRRRPRRPTRRKPTRLEPSAS